MGRPSRHRGLTWIAVSSLLGAGIGSVLVVRAARVQVSPGGPLAQQVPTSSWASIDVAVGEPVSFGLVSFVNRGRSPARVISVRPVAPSSGVRLLGTYVTPVDPEVGVLPGFPPAGVDADTWSPPRGTVVEPGERGFVVVGAEATQEGLQGFEGLEVTYEVGGRRYLARFPHGLLLCVAPHEPSDLCPGPSPDRGS